MTESIESRGSLGEVPDDVREVLARFQETQRAGAETTGSVLEGTRRYELDDGALLYFPELFLATSLNSVLMFVLGIGGLIGTIAGISLYLSHMTWGMWLAISGVVALVVGVKVTLDGAQKDAERRAGVERTGLYLCRDHLVVCKQSHTWVLPRRDILALEDETTSASDTLRRLSLRYQNGSGTKTYEITAGRFEKLKQLITDWLERTTK